jgi:hypothetical protein
MSRLTGIRYRYGTSEGRYYVGTYVTVFSAVLTQPFFTVFSVAVSGLHRLPCPTMVFSAAISTQVPRIYGTGLNFFSISKHLFEYIGTQFPPTFRYTVREGEFDYRVFFKLLGMLQHLGIRR